MKKKSIDKKLILNRQTVGNLNGRAMDKVKGGKTFGCPADTLECPLTYICITQDAAC